MASSNFVLSYWQYVTYYGLISVVALLGNALVIAAFIFDTNIRKKVSNYYILHLALANFLCALHVAIVKLWKSVFGGEDAYERASGCSYWIIQGSSLIYVSLFLLLAITFDRYLLVRDALRYIVIVTKKRTLIVIAICWISGILYSFATNLMNEHLFDGTGDTGGQEADWGTTGMPSISDGLNDNRLVTDKDVVPVPEMYTRSMCMPNVNQKLASYGYYIVVNFVIFFSALVFMNVFVCLKVVQRERSGLLASRDDHTSHGKSNTANDTECQMMHLREARNQEVSVASCSGEIRGDSSNGDGHGNVAMNKGVLEPEHSAMVAAESSTRSRDNQTRGIKNYLSKMTNKFRQLNRNRKTLISISVLVVAFAACWCPFYILSILYHSGLISVSSHVISLSIDLFWVNAAINPFIYAATNPRFRRGMGWVFRRICLCRNG